MGDDIAIFVSDEKITSGLAAESVEYLAWVAEGNTAKPWQPEEPVIEEEPIVEEPIAAEPVIEDAN